jgi:hypothetical protein
VQDARPAGYRLSRRPAEQAAELAQVAQLDLLPRDARDVEQVVDQPPHVGDLPADHRVLARPSRWPVRSMSSSAVTIARSGSAARTRPPGGAVFLTRGSALTGRT